MSEHRFIKALKKEATDVTPIWIMRQAGRYLPEYRATRAKAGDFMQLCQNSQLACEVTLQPLERYALDAAILFSDILTIPDAMGLGLYFEAGEGPKFRRTVRSNADIDALETAELMARLSYVTDAVQVIRHELNDRVPLIGFSGSPWTLATYMIEGGSSKDFRTARGLMYRDPAFLHRLLGVLSDAVSEYLVAQVDAGAQALQIFDTWGGLLSGPCFEQFSLQYMCRIVSTLRTRIEDVSLPIILFTKNGGQWLHALAESGADALGLDWTHDLGQARETVDGKVALQGNMDPAVLLGSDAAIRAEVSRILDSYGKHPGHVFNLGHGITPDVDPDKVAVLVDAVHEISAPYHQ